MLVYHIKTKKTISKKRIKCYVMLRHQHGNIYGALRALRKSTPVSAMPQDRP